MIKIQKRKTKRQTDRKTKRQFETQMCFDRYSKSSLIATDIPRCSQILIVFKDTHKIHVLFQTAPGFQIYILVIFRGRGKCLILSKISSKQFRKLKKINKPLVQREALILQQQKCPIFIIFASSGKSPIYPPYMFNHPDRPGDTIVTVDDWLITLMDKPKVKKIFSNTLRIQTGLRKSLDVLQS